MNDLICIPDLSIVRDVENRPGRAVMIDCDGDYRGSFPAAMTDEHIIEAIRFANECYRKGVEHGKERKAVEIRGVLGLPDPLNQERRIEALETLINQH